MVLKRNSASELFHYHLGDSQAKANTILVDIIFNVELIEHFAYSGWVLQTDPLVAYTDFECLHPRFVLAVLSILRVCI